MNIPKPASSGSPELRNVQPVFLSCFFPECAIYLEASRFTDMSANNSAFTFCGHNNVLPIVDLESLVMRLMHCGKCVMCVSHSVNAKMLNAPWLAGTNRLNLRRIFLI